MLMSGRSTEYAYHKTRWLGAPKRLTVGDWIEFAAAQDGHALCITALAVGGNIDQPNNNGATPCHAAAKWGHSSCIHALVENGADPNTVWRHGAYELVA